MVTRVMRSIAFVVLDAATRMSVEVEYAAVVAAEAAQGARLVSLPGCLKSDPRLAERSVRGAVGAESTRLQPVFGQRITAAVDVPMLRLTWFRNARSMLAAAPRWNNAPADFSYGIARTKGKL